MNTRSEKSVIVSIISLTFMNESACIIQYNIRRVIKCETSAREPNSITKDFYLFPRVSPFYRCSLSTHFTFLPPWLLCFFVAPSLLDETRKGWRISRKKKEEGRKLHRWKFAFFPCHEIIIPEVRYESVETVSVDVTNYR